MSYTCDHHTLNKAFSLEEEGRKIGGTRIGYRNFAFRSEHTGHLPGMQGLPDTERRFLKAVADSQVAENISFRYPVFYPEGRKEFDRVIILLHGLNEKSWDKYLPWAKLLVEKTGYPVMLFPISFHMNRIPPDWASHRSMAGLSRYRQQRYHGSLSSTFANAALSERLDNMPERFALSGYQSVMDLMALTEALKAGRHAMFSQNTVSHFFGYSIGAFLSQVLMIANPGGLFDHSRFVLFAGGAVFSRINGISRFIMDRQAFERLQKFYLDKSNWRRKSLASYADAAQVRDVARAFMAMLSPAYFRALREKSFSRFRDRVLVIALEHDHVFPAADILDAFQKTGVEVNVIGLPYTYTHETPFPVFTDAGRSDLVDQSFDKVLTEAADYLRAYSVYGFSSSL